VEVEERESGGSGEHSEQLTRLEKLLLTHLFNANLSK